MKSYVLCKRFVLGDGFLCVVVLEFLSKNEAFKNCFT
jgi:hypothetical protein